MFNSYNVQPTQNIKINAVTGAILKNHPKRWFERFHLKSPRAERLLAEGGYEAQRKIYNENYRMEMIERDPENDIIVLQMVICGDMEVMAELIYRKDYEEKEGGE